MTFDIVEKKKEEITAEIQYLWKCIETALKLLWNCTVKSVERGGTWRSSTGGSQEDICGRLTKLKRLETRL